MPKKSSQYKRSGGAWYEKADPIRFNAEGKAEIYDKAQGWIPIPSMHEGFPGDKRVLEEIAKLRRMNIPFAVESGGTPRDGMLRRIRSLHLLATRVERDEELESAQMIRKQIAEEMTRINNKRKEQGKRTLTLKEIVKARTPRSEKKKRTLHN